MSSFEEVRFDEEISYGSTGGYGFNTSVIELDSGHEERVSRRSQARHSYDVAMAIKTHEELTSVKKFFLARNGAAVGFRFKDWSDYHSNPTDSSFKAEQGTSDQPCSPSAGNGSTTSFQLIKQYTSGAASYVRTILKPVAGTVRVWVNGSEVMSGWSVNTTTGVILFSSPPTSGHSVRASFEFDVPVRFDVTSDELLSSSIDDWGTGTVNSLVLKEILATDPAPPIDVNYGGCSEVAMTGNTQMSIGSGRLWVVSAASPSLQLILPNPASIPTGHHLFTIINEGANSVILKDHLANTLATIATNQGVDVHLSMDSGSTKIWYAL
jgi:uncharacterized protein (TIGR02217 family)